ncbi:hypothetical protein GPJ56_007497 [Histomonas meleagridis]|uniref:uncharacterized protein n=1 Tax=Histomonas meleagridis TaxID=135588 RepID=UPI00355AB5E5|nr:hypothetical protein GPJ56_007497 [Histomonas meleagridis]KAH0804343.1 hypothetical protein GO595_003173 [Histomonas meleagridis]
MFDDPKGYLTIKKSSLMTFVTGILYGASLIWSFAVSIKWVSTSLGYEDGIWYYDFTYYIIAALSLVSLETIFAFVTLLLLCIKSAILKARKVLTWITAVIGIGTMLAHAFAIKATPISECIRILEDIRGTTFDVNELLGGCFGARSDNAGILPFYLLSHILILYVICINNYFVPDTNDDAQQLPYAGPPQVQQPDNIAMQKSDQQSYTHQQNYY